MNAVEKSDISSNFLWRTKEEKTLTVFLIHILLYNYIINMLLYRLQTIKEIETKYLIQS